MSHVIAIATADTKGEELAYVAGLIRARGLEVRTVDVGTQDPPQLATDVLRDAVAACHPRGADAALGQDDRGRAVTAMGEALAAWIAQEHAAGRVLGAIGLGGSGGTALITPALRALPVGVPKLMVSTVASGDVAPYVDCSDLCMLYSVTDVAGINRVSRQVLGNAAHAIAGMCGHPVPAGDDKPCIAVTMFGVTTPCVTRIRERLEAAGNDVLVFHATGSGGRAMEGLIRSGLVQGVIDATTTEVADHLVGGVFDAGPERLEAAIAAGIPCVVSLGACDMVNFGAEHTVPERFRLRRLHVHNSNVTLMRTTAEENRAIGEWIAAKLGAAPRPIPVLVPEGGVSLLDAPDMPFHDPEADAALFAALEAGGAAVTRRPEAINDPAFADALVEAYEQQAAAPTG